MIAAVMGWIGTIGSISAYVLLSQGRWQARSLRYSALNGVAGLLAASGSAVYGAWPSVVSNLLWSCIAAHSALVTLQERRAASVAAVHHLRAVEPDPEPPTGAQPVLARAA